MRTNREGRGRRVKMADGKYIVLEGAPGVGKTTQLLELARRIQAAGLPVRILQEPDSYNDLTASTIHRLIDDPRYPMSTTVEVLLYNAAQAQSLQTIQDSVAQGIICIVDGNYLSILTEHYYGFGDTPDYPALNKVINFASGAREPDLTVILDAPAATLEERYKGDSKLDEAFLERIRAGYLWEAHQRNLPVIFATSDKATVADELWELVSKQLSSRQSATETNQPTSIKQILTEKNLPAPHEPPLQSDKVTTNGASPAVSESIVINQSSSLLLAKLLANKVVLSQSQTVAKNQARYVTPVGLATTIQTQYEAAMETFLTSYDRMVEALVKHLVTMNPSYDESSIQLQAKAAAGYALPIATTAMLAVQLPVDDEHGTIQRLLHDPLPEFNSAGRQLVARSSTPQNIDDRPRKQSANKSAPQLQTAYSSDYREPVKLLDYWPRNELLLINDLLFADSHLSQSEIQKETSTWTYDSKATLLADHGQNIKSSSVATSHYSFEIVSDYRTFMDVLPLLDNVAWQELTPRYGYEIPELIEQAGLTDQFEACFDTSLVLHSLLQQQGKPSEAQYATLMGHRLRWRVNLSSSAAANLLQQSNVQQNQKATLLLTLIQQRIAEVHPIVANLLRPTNSSIIEKSYLE
jgi:dTMP kinase